MEYDLRRDLPRGHDGAGVAPSAEFTGTDHIRNSRFLRFSKGKHFLGVIDAEIEQVELPDGRIDRFCVGGIPIGIQTDMHVVTIAGSRSGKSRAAMLDNLVTYPGSILCVDPKGELSETALYRQRMGQQSFVLDPFEVAGKGAETLRRSFNPMEMLHPENRRIVEDAGLIADAIVVPVPGSLDPHWDESAKNLIEGLILHVATATPYEGARNLATVYEKLSRFDAALLEEMDQNMAARGAVEEAAKAFAEKADRERESVLSSARRHMRFLGYESMQNVLTGESISLSELKTKGTTIYLCLPAMRLGTCSRWLRMVINMTLGALEEEKTKPPYPVLLILDEFAILGHMKESGRFRGVTPKCFWVWSC